MNAIIIDDEIDAITTIELLAKEYFPEINIVSVARDIGEGYKQIEEKKPDVVFLDIEMQQGNGFDLMEKFPKRDFEVIFITAYNEYKVVAEAYDVPYYINKPIDVDELKPMLDEIKEKRS